jgi:HD-GYP domain-containing protein (c-di-GMP phosphodiesterase class II)
MATHRGLNVPIYDLVNCLADTIDLASPELANHHRRVGLIAHAIACQLGLPEEARTELFFAGNLHDIGALSLQERIRLLDFEVDKTERHAETGALLLELFTPLSGIADLVRFHHTNWDGGAGAVHRGKPVPLGAHILHLADRIAVLMGKSDRIMLLTRVRDIRGRIGSEAGGMFVPRLVEAFSALSRRESFWLGIAYPPRDPALEKMRRFRAVRLDTEGIVGLSRLFARIIDFRSRFTATHSSGVAASAEALARLAGRPAAECAQMRIAGLLHDLGKLAVPAEIIEKPGKLSPQERSVMCCHTFFTRRALSNIKSFKSITEWSSYHHEKLDGSGYPFHVRDRDLSLGARIVSVSDVFTAITEDRPYRAGMDRGSVTAVISDMVSRAALDTDVVALLMDNYEELNELRMASQFEAVKEYQEIGARVQALSC